MENWQLVMQSWQLVSQQNSAMQRSPEVLKALEDFDSFARAHAAEEKAAGHVLEAAELIVFADQASLMTGHAESVDPSRTVAPASAVATGIARPGRAGDAMSDAATAQAQPAHATTEAQPAAPAKAPEARQPETPVATLPAPSIVATTSPEMPILALPTAPPPVTEQVPPPAATPVTNAPPITPPVQALVSLPPSLIADLVQRGNYRLTLGDVLSARLFFERAAAAGSEDGEMSAAKTYDPKFLATIGAPGLQPNVKRAIDWYRIAATTHGNAEAQRRVDDLTTAGAQ